MKQNSGNLRKGEIVTFTAIRGIYTNKTMQDFIWLRWTESPNSALHFLIERFYLWS